MSVRMRIGMMVCFFYASAMVVKEGHKNIIHTFIMHVCKGIENNLARRNFGIITINYHKLEFSLCLSFIIFLFVFHQHL